MQNAEDILCAVLRGEPSVWNSADPAAIAQFLESGNYHGALPLLAAEFASRKDFGSWPEQIRAACGKAARYQTVYELAHRVEMNHVLDALATAGVTPLLLKGTALAYSHYANPALRPRGDTDFLIPRDARSATERTLEQLGYSKAEGVEGEFVSYQSTWSRTDKIRVTHHLDVHWRISNSQVLASALTYDELARRAFPLPASGPHALAPAPVDALLFACMHRAGHVNTPYYADGHAHFGGDRLIWLYDIHLLVSSLSTPELDEFAALATEKRIKAICLDGLLRTREHLGTTISPRVLDALSKPGQAEPSAHFLNGGKIRLMLEEVRALDRWADRMGWLRELAFPPARYMRGKYPDALVRWLPVLYLRRGFAGISRLFLPRDAGKGH